MDNKTEKLKSFVKNIDIIYQKRIEKPLHRISFYFCLILGLITMGIAIYLLKIQYYGWTEAGFVFILGSSVIGVAFWHKVQWIKNKKWK